MWTTTQSGGLLGTRRIRKGAYVSVTQLPGELRLGLSGLESSEGSRGLGSFPAPQFILPLACGCRVQSCGVCEASGL